MKPGWAIYVILERACVTDLQVRRQKAEGRGQRRAATDPLPTSD